jgi:hypothetical protein
MALILARSPYFINRQGFDNNASLTLDLQIIDSDFDIVLLKTYTFSFRLQTAIDISPFIRDYLTENKVVLIKATINGNLLGVAQTPVVENHIATDGYSYFEEGYNKDGSVALVSNNYYAGSNDILQLHKPDFLRIPFLFTQPDGFTFPSSDEGAWRVTINVYDSNNDLIQSFDNDFSPSDFPNGDYQTSSRLYYVFIGIGSANEYKERVLSDLGIYEESGCLVLFMDELEFNIKRIEILSYDVNDASLSTKTLTVETIEECKYEPKEVHFVNRYGVEETFWFFKKNVKSITVEKETYRPNIVGSYANGVLSHQYQDYNVNGREKIVLNTGFVNESFSENIKQLMLSEKVWVYDNGIKRPINVSTSEMELRTHVNDKLINYTMEFEFSNEIINNVG